MTAVIKKKHNTNNKRLRRGGCKGNGLVEARSSLTLFFF
jgi:hypothetical protein